MSEAKKRINDMMDNSNVKKYEPCKNCKFRNKDTKDGYKKTICEKYPPNDDQKLVFKPMKYDAKEPCKDFEEG